MKSKCSSDHSNAITPDNGMITNGSTPGVGLLAIARILIAFIVILIFIILVLLLNILKDKRKRSKEKEEWINPIYEGFEEGKESGGSTESKRSNIISQPDLETLDDGIYYYVVTNKKPRKES